MNADQLVMSVVLAKDDGKAVKAGGGWVFSRRFFHFQKCGKKVYAYIRPNGEYNLVQAYIRGTAAFCSLEARVYGELQSAVDIAEHWLSKYSENIADMETDRFNPFNKDGWEGREVDVETVKEYIETV